MAFHIEISSGMRHARAFNLGQGELDDLIEHWVTNRKIGLGDREWEPRESQLKVLEGPHLDTPELSFGQGWSNAERGSENVTRRVVSEGATVADRNAPIAVTVDIDEAGAQTVSELVSDPGAHAISWEEARARVDGRDPEIAAIVLVRRRRAEPGPAAPAATDPESRRNGS